MNNLLNKIAQTGSGLPVPNFDQIEKDAFGGNFAFQGKNLSDIVSVIYRWSFVFAGMGLLVFLIWGGISFMLAKGDQKAVEGAKGKITTALIGFIIIFFAFWITQLVGSIFGLTAITATFGRN